MKIKWNKYTWYSRTAALLFFLLVLPVLTFYIGEQYGVTVTEINSQPITSPSTVHYSHLPTPVVEIPTPTDQPSTPSVAPGIHASNVIITTADTGKTITLHKGDQFLLKLGELDWTLSFSKPSIVNRVKNIMVIRGAQGIYTADTIGTTVLTGTGKPICAEGSMCAMYMVAFKVTLKVIK